MEHGTSDPRSSCPTCKAVFRGGFLRCPRDGSLLSTTDADPLVGTVLADRYQIEALLGEGGIGRVYRARHARMSRRYAVKVPFGELNYDAKVRARFANEAEAASRLSHPNVVGVIDVGETPEGLIYLTMDLVEGESLATTIAREGALPADRVRRIFAQITEGLRHAHERGLVHRDLKPENIILEQDAEGADRPRIVDFGIAILKGDSGGRLTTEGIVLGTPHYMAPEQATDQGIDHRTDLFSLGLILYEMLSGVLPHDGSPLDVARKNLSVDAPPITERVRGLQVDRLMEGLAFRLIEKRPDARPQTATEVLRLLDLIRTDRKTARVELKLGEVVEADEMGVAPVGARPPRVVEAEGLVTSEARPTDRVVATRRPIFIAGAVVVVVMLLALFLITRGNDGEPKAGKPDAGVVVAAIRLDAVPPADAAVIADAEPAPIVDGGAPKKVEAGRAPPKRDAGAPKIDAGAPMKIDAGPTTPPSQKTLTALYEDVGQDIDALITAKGASAGASFKKRYLAIPYMDAIRKPEQRVDAMSKLRALAKDVAAASK